MFCNCTSAINISKNPVQHSKIKQRDIVHQFIKIIFEKNVIILEYINTEWQLTDLLTKALDTVRFKTLRKFVDMCIMH